jgi:hypothetical protein
MKKGKTAFPFWKQAERTIAAQLRLKGVPCKLIGSQHLDWDIETKSGLHVECKAARLLRGRRKTHLIRSPFWVVGIARPKGRTHQLREKSVDFYIIRLLGQDFRKVYVILPAPLKVKQLQITVRQLLTKFRDNIDAWHLIVAADKKRPLASRARKACSFNSMGRNHDRNHARNPRASRHNHGGSSSR